jgi:hypothetical protein
MTGDQAESSDIAMSRSWYLTGVIQARSGECPVSR